MMPGLRYIALCLTVGGLLNGITPVAGQPVATPLSDPPIHTRYTHRAWTTDDGLPQNAASALVQTRDGYLWIGTYQGLARFDGVRFTVFEAATTDGLDSDRITTLLEDQDGDLWIGTDTGGLSRYRNGRFTAFAEFEGLPHRSVFRLFEDYNGTLWVRTVTGPIVHEEQRNSRTHFVSDPRFSDTNVIAIHASVTEPGTLWGATKQGVMRLRAGERKIVLGASDVNSIVEQADGTLWFGAGNTVRRLKNGQVDSYPIPQGYSEQLFVDRSDTVWALANGSGLYYFNGAGFTKLSLPNDPIGTTVVSMLEDREGTLWVGTIAQGLHQLRERLFRSYTVEDGLPGQQILGVHEDDEGAIWAGTTSNGLVRIHEGAVHTFTTEDGLPHNRV
ncbi:MAG TPA: two-component regulator propeller domain-containing protein, partial [Rhodothermales bacterium]|nr:two-component regulator propeller domain-containing protein [Rhodothermales bacterium]